MARFWQLRNENWQLPDVGAIMGILNVTPDSFSDGGKHNTRKTAMAHAQRLIAEGADIIDIGGESTRPGATPVPEKEERRRVLPILRALRKKYPTLRISVDTRNVGTARAALEAGADIINDVTGLTNPAMMQLCAESNCGIVIMHLRGTLFHQPDAPYFFDIISEVHNFFEAQVAAAEAAGIDLARICLDPGIGFGKSLEQNLALIDNLEKLRVRNLPLLMGLSRKRFLERMKAPIPNTLGLNIPPEPPFSENEPSPIPTIAMSMLAADNGANIHRVHDVIPHRDALHTRHYAIQQKIRLQNDPVWQQKLSADRTFCKDLAGRITQAIENSGRDIGELSKVLYIRYVTLQKYADGVLIPKYTHLIDIAQELDVSLTWLLTGKDDKAELQMWKQRAEQAEATLAALKSAMKNWQELM